MLSFSKGRPLAKIIGGQMNGKFICINSGETDKCCEKCSDRCRKRKCCRNCNLCCQEDSDDDIGDSIEIDGKLEPVPNIEGREAPYIAGPSGSGKSTYAGKYIQYYKKLFPNNQIYVFSRKPSDPAIDHLYPNRIMIDESLVTEPIDILSELADGALVLFDDCDTIQNDKVKKAVSKIKNDILETGRAAEIYIVTTSHLVNPNERKDSRTILNECHSLTIFPKSGSAYQIKYALKNYFGLSKNQIDEILSLPSRWVTIFKSYPQCVLYEKGCYIPQ